MMPRASAEVTAFIAAAISLAFSIDGSVNLTGRSRHGGKMRSMQSRNAVGSPARASSTALRVKASDSPSSSTAAVSVFLLRQPYRHRRVARPDFYKRPAAHLLRRVRIIQSSEFPWFNRHPVPGAVITRLCLYSNLIIIANNNSWRGSRSSEPGDATDVAPSHVMLELGK